MKTYTTLRSLFGSITNNNSTANLTLGDTLINDQTRRILFAHDWFFMQKTATATTVASQQFYNLPYDYGQLTDVSVTISSFRYTPREAPSREFWDRLNVNTNITATVPEYYFIFAGQLGFYPTPSASSNTITYSYKPSVIDLSAADYTTGTLSVTTATAAVTGSGTSWRRNMVGSWLQITPNITSDTTSGDGVWYQVSAVGTTTALTLSRAYNGGTVAAGSYTLGQVSLLPESYQDLPVYGAGEIYFSSIQPEPTQAALYKRRYDEGFARLKAEYGSRTSDVVITDGDILMHNPNNFVFLT